MAAVVNRYPGCLICIHPGTRASQRLERYSKGGRFPCSPRVSPRVFVCNSSRFPLFVLSLPLSLSLYYFSFLFFFSRYFLLSFLLFRFLSRSRVHCRHVLLTASLSLKYRRLVARAVPFSFLSLFPRNRETARFLEAAGERPVLAFETKLDDR